MYNKTIISFISLFLIVTNLSAQQTKAAKLASDESAYIIHDSVLIKARDGALLSAIIVRKKEDANPKPVILQYTIYVRDKGRDLQIKWYTDSFVNIPVLKRD